MTQPTPVPSPESLLEHREWLRAIARSLVVDENDVDEVEQRTWLRVLHNRRPVTSVRGWLRHVVRSAAVDEHRSVSRRQAREERSARPESLPPTDHLVVQLEAQRAVAQAVAGLPEPYRTTVLLRYIEELSVDDVAARMTVPVKTVQTRIRRALALLRDALDREFGDRRGWCVALLPFIETRSPIPVGAATTGAILMATKMKLIAAAVAVALLATGIVWTATSGSDGTSRTDVAAAPTSSPDQHGKLREHPAGPKFAIVGRARSRGDGRGVAGAHVVVESGARGAATVSVETSDDGTFRVANAVAGTLRVTAPRRRAVPVDVSAPVAGVEVVDVGDVWLDAATSLVVEVLGPDDARIADAEVRLVRTRRDGEIATTHSYLRAMADPEFATTTVGVARTGADGVAHFPGIVPGRHELVARAKTLVQSGDAWIDVPAGRDETRTTVRLERACRITGRVLTATGEPAADRLVDAGAAGWDRDAFASTGADGRFALESVPAGDVNLRVGRTRGTNLVVAVVRVPDISDIELRLPPMGAIVGTVTTADGRPAAGAEVGVEVNCGWNLHADAMTRTNAQGQWRIEEMPTGAVGRFVVRAPGLYHVGPRLEGGRLVERRGGKDLGIDARVPAGGELRLDATMAKGARLHGKVVGPDGVVAGAWVYLHLKATKGGQEWETAVTDADGRYSFDFLPPGPAAAVPLHPALVHPDAPKELGTALAAGTLPASLTFDLPDGGDVERDFTMLAGTRVSGRVVGPAGEPVEGATVRVDAATYSSPPTPIAVTDASGAFVIERVAGFGQRADDVLSQSADGGMIPKRVAASGTSKLRVEAPGLVQTNVPEVATSPGGRVDGVEVRMATARRVTGHVFDADGAPVAGARVTLPQARSRPIVAWTDAAGGYALTAWNFDGKLTVAASGGAKGDGRVDVGITAGGAVADVRLPPTTDIFGTVTAVGGGPLAGACVIPRFDPSMSAPWFYGELLGDGHGAPDSVRAITDERGRFHVALATGEWGLIVRRDGFVDAFATVRVPAPGAVAVEMRTATTLSGTLRGEDGKPLPGAVVLLDPGPDVTSPRFSIPRFDHDRLRGMDRLLYRHTNASGGFAFPGIPEGDYALVVVLAGDSPQNPKELRFGPLRPAAGPYDLSLASPISSALSGRIVDAGGAPYRDAIVLINVLTEGARGVNDPIYSRQLWSEVTAQPDGTFHVEGLTAPSYTLQVSVQSKPRTSTVQPGGVAYGQFQQCVFHGLRPPRRDLVLEMVELPRLRGRIVDDAGAPLVGWTLMAVSVGDATALSADTRTRDDGTFEIRNVEDADYRLTLQREGQAARRVVLARPVRGGQELGDVVATLEGRVRGRVIDAKGASVAGATVQIYPSPWGAIQSVTTAADGTFEGTGLDLAAIYRVGVVGANGGMPGSGTNRTVDVRPGTNDLRLVRE